MKCFFCFFIECFLDKRQKIDYIESLLKSLFYSNAYKRNVWFKNMMNELLQYFIFFEHWMVAIQITALRVSFVARNKDKDKNIWKKMPVYLK